MDDGRIETLVEGPVGWLVLCNEARRNAMSYDMYAAVPAAVQALLDAGVRCIVVRGAGTVAFGAGSDISEFPAKRMGPAAGDFDAAEHRAHLALIDAPVPVVAMIHGACRGGGLALALSCDIRVADDRSTFAVPPARLGVGYGLDAVGALVAAVGDGRTRTLLLSAAAIDAERALAMGLVDEIVAPATLEPRIRDLTAQISALAPLSLAAAKTTLAHLRGTQSRTAAESAIRACYASADYREGIAAFLEKRTPRFTGR